MVNLPLNIGLEGEYVVLNPCATLDEMEGERPNPAPGVLANSSLTELNELVLGEGEGELTSRTSTPVCMFNASVIEAKLLALKRPNPSPVGEYHP